MREALFYETGGGRAVGCRLCPHSCVLRPGGTGLCGVRRNVDGVLYAESYGCVSGMAMDPIEKKPLRRFYPGSRILSVGSYGCNLSCSFCQNSSISQEVPQTRFVSPEALAETAKGQPGNLGVAFTYNEPLVGMEYLLDAAPLLKSAGLKTVLVTNGTVNAGPLEALLPFVDAMNIDVKCFTEQGYETLGGDLGAVKQSVKRCAEACHVEITALIVPGENDTAEEMQALSRWLASVSPGIPLHITRFFPRYQMTDRPPTPVPKLEELAAVARRELETVYLGNV